MACKNTCKVCDKLVVSTAIAYADGVLTVTIPEGIYANGEKYCLVFAQNIPADAIIGAPVVIQIGTGTQRYALTKCNCAPATPCNLRTRTRYATKVVTTAAGGSFRLLGNCNCAPDNSRRYIDGTDA